MGEVTVRVTPKGANIADYWSGTRFERYEITFILQILQPNMTFFDIGANIGFFSLLAGKKEPTASVYAFEPCSWTFGILKRNIALNDLQNVKAYRFALGNKEGKALLKLNAWGLDGLNTIGQPTHPDCRIVGEEEVPLITLDRFIAQHNIQRVDLMKVDVEGAELLVFEGAYQLLSRNDAPLILYEGYSWNTKGFGYHPVEIMWLLKDHGYFLFVLDSKSERLIPRSSNRLYDAMMVAVKPNHALYGAVLKHTR